MQIKALRNWCNEDRYVFVYESIFGNVSGWLIHRLTSNIFLSRIGRIVGKVIPSLRANTFDVGVFFRGNHEWWDISSDTGFRILVSVEGENESISLLRQLLLIKLFVRNSYSLTVG